MKSKDRIIVTKESLLVYCAMAKYYHISIELLLSSLLKSKGRCQN